MQISHYLKGLPLSFQDTARYIDTEDGNQFAWTYKDTLPILNYLKRGNFAICGIELYGIDNNDSFPLHETWSMDHNSIDWETYQMSSIHSATHFITQNYNLYGDICCFLLDISDEEMLRIKTYFPIKLPQDLLVKAISLHSLGFRDVAWKYLDALAVLIYLGNKKIAILGGDVYSNHGNEIATTYDSWYLDRSGTEWDNYVAKSNEKSVAYIHNYYQKNGNDYMYAFAISTKTNYLIR